MRRPLLFCILFTLIVVILSGDYSFSMIMNASVIVLVAHFSTEMLIDLYELILKRLKK